MTPEIVRPGDSFTQEKWDELQKYLLDHWDRAVQGRARQVDGDYKKWDLNYRGIPAEKKRTVPWYGASNFVVKLIRMFLDTFVCRSLGIIFATHPLYKLEGYPREVRESLELYVERKALIDWKHYQLARDMVFRGNKNGTCVVKVPWTEETTYTMVDKGNAWEDVAIPEFVGPRPYIIPFEDFYCYPITANYMCDLKIKFHRVRILEEEVRRRSLNWRGVTEEDLQNWLVYPADIKRKEQESQAGVSDDRLRELQAVECYLKWPLSSDPSRLYRIVGTLIPGPASSIGKLVDVYFDPYEELFFDYRPFPKEDLFYGESMCEILEQAQEESSTIHNDRRNNSYLANAPVFKRRSGSLLPNPSSNWYPGKCWDLESMEDFEVVDIGRNYDPMLDQEEFTLQLSERLIGIGAIAQGFASGVMGRRGVYNSQGTMAILSESNQRQDINIRDVREVIAGIGRSSFMLQRLYGGDDPMLEMFSEKQRSEIEKALAYGSKDFLRKVRFELNTSSAAMNSEIEKQNLMSMMQILGQYGASVQQLAMLLVDPNLNPSIRLVINDIVTMQKWMASRALRAFKEEDVESILPDVKAAIEATVPGGGRGTTEASGGTPPAGPVGMDFGGLGAPPVVPNQQLFQDILALPQLPPGPNGVPGMGM